MATLFEIGTSGIAGTAPTPVSQVAINKYLVNDALMNLMQFQNNGMGSSIGNIQSTFVYYEGTSEATFRALGKNYTPDNETPLTETVTLKNLGGSLEVDINNVRAFSTQAGGVANFVEQQIGQKLNATKNLFAKAFLTGDSEKDSKQFDGLNKKIVASQVISTPIDVSALDDAKYRKVEIELNKVISKIRPSMPNAIITTQTGKAYLNGFNSFRHAGVDVIEVNHKKYNQFMGMPIVDVTDDCFPSEDLAIGIPVIFMYIDMNEGVRVAIPMDGEVVKILPPQFNNGQVVSEGAVDMLCAPIFANPFAVAKCYLGE